MFGKALGLPVTYYSFPQRLAFIRNTLRYKLPGQDFPCDIVMGVPAGFDQVSVTKPYYRSTYAMIFPQGKGLDLYEAGPIEAILRDETVNDILVNGPQQIFVERAGKLQRIARPGPAPSPMPQKNP